ncbi:MAG: hypothetical protein KC416_02780 [Myxococcales bacterium]|nr:hypothetical protein [Myxococcales bacterium]
MSVYQRPFPVLVPAAILAMAVFSVACSSERGSGTQTGSNSNVPYTVNADGSVTYPEAWCSPGAQYDCLETDPCTGARLCMADGRTLGACVCGAGGGSQGDPKDAEVPLPVVDAGPAKDAGNPPPPPATGCTSAADQAAIGTGFGGSSIEDLIAVCTLQCSLGGGSPNCMDACVGQLTMGKVSQTCIACYSALSECTAPCSLACAIGSDPSCTPNCECGFGGLLTNCRGAFDACTGIPTNYCDGF